METSTEILPQVINAYLESETTVLVALSTGVVLPYAPENVTIIDMTNGQQIGVTTIENARIVRAAIVGDLQHILGAPNNWNTDDEHTSLKEVHPNLYQYTATLPMGTYHYKLAFYSWDNIIPTHDNIVLDVPADNTQVTFSYVPYDSHGRQPQVYDSINNPEIKLPTTEQFPANLLKISVATPLDVTHTVKISVANSRFTTIISRHVLNTDQFIYTGNDLGYLYTPQATSFRLWAPTASLVQLFLYDSELGPLTQKFTLERAEQGTWKTTIELPLENWYYLYEVTIQGKTQTAVDPYARALALNGGSAMIVDLAKTNPSDWEADTYKKIAHPVDAVIYEMHTRDFSINKNSGLQHAGKFLALTERGTTGPEQVTTGIDSLKELGITHIQILPAYEFASIDESDPTQYNWGYDPRNYNVPEGAYASSTHGTARISEYKQMIKSLHASNLGLIMDVVYNHTFSVGSSDFDKIVPQYYYRTDDFGNYTNGSGCGNEVASERPMVQKFIRDSVKYWVQEYHVDGFRFDLMALIGVDTMQKIAEDLHEINPSLLLYGEPWAGGSTALPGKQMLYKGQQKNLGVGVFNDNLRNSLIGSPFERASQGFATGAKDQTENIKRAVTGSIHDFAANPNEVINYATSHDNYALWDKITASNAAASQEVCIKMDMLVQAIIMTSQGVPFFQGGEEFLRTKGGNDNSYNAGDAVNQFDWARKATYYNVFAYYAKIIQLRQHHPAFRMNTAKNISKHLSFLDSPTNTIVFQLGDHANHDPWKRILVIYNPNAHPVTIHLPTGNWTLVGTQNHIDEQGIEHVTGTIEVTYISCTILYQA